VGSQKHEIETIGQGKILAGGGVDAREGDVEDVDVRCSMSDMGGETIPGGELDTVELSDEGETWGGMLDGERVYNGDAMRSEDVGQRLEWYVEGAGTE